MELIFLLAFAGTVMWQLVRVREQRQRIRLLASHLGKYQIEKHVETLTQGYLRALGEPEGERREQVFNLLKVTEQALDNQFSRFVADLARADEAATRVSKLPFHFPLATTIAPSATFDLRRAMATHGRGIHAAIAGTGHDSQKSRAFVITAELLLMQHTCHWYCKSKLVASSRMLARHQTAYLQLVSAVTDVTRVSYCPLVV